MNRAVGILLTGLLAIACARPTAPVASPRPTRQPSAGIAQGPTGSSGPSPTPAPGPTAPAPDAPIPERPGALATALQGTMTELYRSIDGWLDGPHRPYPPEDLQLRALFVQRATRSLATHPGLERKVLERLPRRFALEVEADAEASRRLFAHANPVKHPHRIRTRRPLPPETLLSYYREAQRRFGVPWEVLAAVNLVESKFGRVRSSSSAGAQGPMQFLPSVWAAYGLGGDVNDPHDAILGAANYLHANGAPSDLRRALYAYNPIVDYVEAVLAYAHQMERDPRSLFVYHGFQVFVFTKHGEVQLTGPGT